MDQEEHEELKQKMRKNSELAERGEKAASELVKRRLDESSERVRESTT